MSAVNINNNNFHDEVINSSKPVLLDFWSPRCGPCRAVLPIVEEIADENPHIKVGKINVEEHPELAIQFKIRSVPTLMVMQNGEIKDKSAGARNKGAILSMLQSIA